MTTYNVVSPGALVAGQPEDISVVLANFNAIAAVLNGNIDNANVAAAAAIAASKLGLGTPAAGKYLDGAGSWIILPGAASFPKNLLRNGRFDNWLNNGTLTDTGVFMADAWMSQRAGSTHNVSQQAFTPGQTAVAGEPSWFHRTAVTSVAGAGNLDVLAQLIAGGVRPTAGQTVTLSFYAKADANKNIAVEVQQSFGAGGSASVSASVTTVPLTTSWVKQTITFTMPSVSGKTFGSALDESLNIYFWFDAGSNYNARTNSLGQQSGTFDIAMVQLEIGAAASAFETYTHGERPGEYKLHEYGTPGTAVSIIDWLGISPKYRTLKIVANLRSTAAGDHNLVLRFNNDSGANYRYQYVYGQGAGANGIWDGGAASGSPIISPYPGSASAASASLVITIPNYANPSLYKSAVAHFASLGTSFQAGTSGILWQNTAAINRVQLIASSDNFEQSSHFALYGVI